MNPRIIFPKGTKIIIPKGSFIELKDGCGIENAFITFDEAVTSNKDALK